MLSNQAELLSRMRRAARCVHIRDADLDGFQCARTARAALGPEED